MMPPPPAEIKPASISAKKASGNAATEDDDLDCNYTSHEPLHTKPALCRDALRALTASVSLDIRASGLCNGSGLFVAETSGLDAGCDIYRAPLSLAAVEPEATSICHGCFRDGGDTLGGTKANDTEVFGKCSACRVARFCSKQCQKTTWSLYHKDECKILGFKGNMAARSLLMYRLVFWLRRKKLSPMQKTALDHLESHFAEYTNDPKCTEEVMAFVQELNSATGKVWTKAMTAFPKLRVNCVPLRPPSGREAVGYVLDVATAMINHSCDPNAFAFLEGPHLRVRSLKRIDPGEEITICYVDPTLDVLSRQKLLKEQYFLTCSCPRCSQELKHLSAVIGDTPTSISATLDAVTEARSLVRSAVRASKVPGAYPKLEDLPTLESRLRAIMTKPTLSGVSWPESVEPFPSFRLTFAMLYLRQKKPVPALRNALRGLFHRHRRFSGPDWVNDMLDVFLALLEAGSLPPDVAVQEDETFPQVADIRAVAFRYLIALCHGATKAFGEDCAYMKALGEVMAVMVQKRSGPPLGTKDFAQEFEAAQRKVLDWAGLTGESGISSEFEMPITK